MNRSKSVIVSKRWGYISSILKSATGTSPEQFSKLLQTNSVRINGAAIVRDIYVAPKTELLIFWECNTYQPVREETWDPIFSKNNSFLVVDKLAGLPTIATRDNNTQNMLYYLKRKLPREMSAAPILLTTRLDSGTHGLLVFGRTPQFQTKYNKLVSGDGVTKHYQAVVLGWGKKHNKWTLPVRLKHYLSDPRKRIFDEPDNPPIVTTEDATIQHFPWNKAKPPRVKASTEQTKECPLQSTLVIKSAIPCPPDCLPLRPFDDSIRNRIKDQNPMLITILLETGRTHQIRAQLESQGLHIVGDASYGCPSEMVVEHWPFALCCVGLQFLEHNFDIATKSVVE